MKVLSIDGGGIRGLIPALVLAEIERRTGRRIAELFDLIAGTSTGGILASALTRRGADDRARYSAEELVELYVTEGPKIFDRVAAQADHVARRPGRRALRRRRPHAALDDPTSATRA